MDQIVSVGKLTLLLCVLAYQIILVVRLHVDQNVSAAQNVLTTRHVRIKNVLTLVQERVVQTQYAVRIIIVLYVHVHQVTLEIHLQDATKFHVISPTNMSQLRK